MAITHPTGFPLAANGDTLANPAVTTYTMPNAYSTTSDLAIFKAILIYTTINISSITGTKSGTWTLQKRNTDATNSSTTDIWTAPVTSTSGADVLTITYSGSTTGSYCSYWGDCVTAGAGYTWSVVITGITNTGSTTTFTYPSLTSATTTNPQAYIGIADNLNTAGGGSTSGFTYVDSPSNSGTETVFNLSLASNTTYAPTSTTSPAGYTDTTAIIIEAGILTPVGNEVKAMQAVKRASFH